jgi:hypothetical protein
MLGWGGVWGGGGVSCFHGHLNKSPLGDLNKSPWENYLEGGGSEEIIKSTSFCIVHYVLNSDIKYLSPVDYDPVSTVLAFISVFCEHQNNKWVAGSHMNPVEVKFQSQGHI